MLSVPRCAQHELFCAHKIDFFAVDCELRADVRGSNSCRFPVNGGVVNFLTAGTFHCHGTQSEPGGMSEVTGFPQLVCCTICTIFIVVPSPKPEKTPISASWASFKEQGTQFTSTEGVV